MAGRSLEDESYIVNPWARTYEENVARADAMFARGEVPEAEREVVRIPAIEEFSKAEIEELARKQEEAASEAREAVDRATSGEDAVPAEYLDKQIDL